MWQAYTKYIRAQCNKDRLVDSLLYGFYFKKTAEGDETLPPQYMFATDAKRSNAFSDFKLVQGPDNFSGLPKNLIEGKENV